MGLLLFISHVEELGLKKVELKKTKLMANNKHMIGSYNAVKMIRAINTNLTYILSKFFIISSFNLFIPIYKFKF